MPIRHNDFQVMSLRLGGLNVNQIMSFVSFDTGVDTYRVVGVDTGAIWN